MDNPTEYLLIGKGERSEDWTKFSNLDWGKCEAVKRAQILGTAQTVYKLVPVFEASVEVITKILPKEFTQP